MSGVRRQSNPNPPAQAAGALLGWPRQFCFTSPPMRSHVDVNEQRRKLHPA